MNIQEAAEMLLKAERTKTPIAPFTSSTETITVDDAYAIQLYQIQQRLDEGAVAKGLKIGLTSKAMQEMLNVHTPDYGFVLDTMVYEENRPVSPTRFIQPKVEFEIAFVLKKDLKGPNVTAEDVINATDYVVPAMEIIDSRIADWEIQFEDTVADNGSSAGAILGSQRTKLNDIDLGNVVMNAYKNGELIDTAKGSAVLDNPINAVVWLANEVAKYNVTLEAGMFILSGALSKAVSFAGGDSFTADFGLLGKVNLSFQDVAVKR